MTSAPDTSATRKKIALALQGGGAHGAFTWGALERLFEDERIEIEAFCGASAGAMNAVVAAHGLAMGGAERAKEALAAFWRKVADAGALSPIQATPLDRAFGPGNLDFSPGFLLFDNLSRMFSPYQLNPLGFNPLGPLIESVVDFEALRACGEAAPLFICATDVERGTLRVFPRSEITRDAVLASACLPNLFHAVEIDGRRYWDGGFMGNPPLRPLIESSECRDIVVVHINPIQRAQLPTTALEITDRMNELNFNATLVREMHEIDLANRLIEGGLGCPETRRIIRLHSILADDVTGALTTSSKLNAERSFLERLRAEGRARADAFLAESFDDLGERSTSTLRYERSI